MQAQDCALAGRSVDSRLHLGSVRYLPRGGTAASESSGITGATVDSSTLDTSYLTHQVSLCARHCTVDTCASADCALLTFVLMPLSYH